MGSTGDTLPSTPTYDTEMAGNSSQVAGNKQQRENLYDFQQTNKANKQGWDQTNQANRPDIQTAYGSQGWTQGPDGKWKMNTQFSGDLGDANNSLQSQYASAMRNPMGTGDDARNQAIDSAYGQATSRLDPQWDKRQSSMDAQLRNQGLDPSSEAYKSQMQDFGQQRNDAYSSAMSGAIGQGAQAGHMAFQDNMAARNNPLQQMQAMNSLTETPKFNGAGQQQTADLKPVDWLAATRDTNDAALRGEKLKSDTIAGWTKMGVNAVSPLSSLGGK